MRTVKQKYTNTMATIPVKQTATETAPRQHTPDSPAASCARDAVEEIEYDILNSLAIKRTTRNHSGLVNGLNNSGEMAKEHCTFKGQFI